MALWISIREAYKNWSWQRGKGSPWGRGRSCQSPKDISFVRWLRWDLLRGLSSWQRAQITRFTKAFGREIWASLSKDHLRASTRRVSGGNLWLRGNSKCLVPRFPIPAILIMGKASELFESFAHAELQRQVHQENSNSIHEPKLTYVFLNFGDERPWNR